LAVQNFVQFNGFFGYRWCENRGTRVDNKTVYNYEEISVLRDKKSVEECARRANESQYPVKGLKVYSVFSLFLTLFDIILGIVFDSMHCVDLGVMKQLATLWFNPKNFDQPWYMGLSLKDINSKMSNIFPPSNVSRLPASLCLRSNWKSSE
jgi:hypothetical protein